MEGSGRRCSEFFVSVTRKVVAPLTVLEARERLQHYVQI
jgi:hypothetical protein